MVCPGSLGSSQMYDSSTTMMSFGRERVVEGRTVLVFSTTLECAERLFPRRVAPYRDLSRRSTRCQLLRCSVRTHPRRLKVVPTQVSSERPVELVLEQHERLEPQLELRKVRELLFGADRQRGGGSVVGRGGGGRFVVDK